MDNVNPVINAYPDDLDGATALFAKGFIEAHHRQPLGELEGEVVTRCPNLDCPAQIKNNLRHLASRGAQSNVVMDRLARQAATLLGERADLDTMLDYVSHGIVCVDEVDKIRATVGGEPNVKGIVAQDSLLTLMENENIQVELPYFEAGNWRSVTTPVNTQHILFVAGGAFEELYDQVFQRVTQKSGADKFYKLVPRADGSLERRFVFDMASHLAMEDIFNYGMTPQFLSRFDSVIMLGDLQAPHLVA